jgi:anti-sigma factor RsiW
VSAQSACRRISDLLSSYMDGDLTVSERWDVKLHLESCAACARFSAELEATVSALHQLRGLAQFAMVSSVKDTVRKPNGSLEAPSGKRLPN